MDPTSGFQQLVVAEIRTFGILVQMAIGQYIIRLSFDNNNEIGIESFIEHLDPLMNVVSKYDIYGLRKEFTFYSFLGKENTNVIVESDDICLLDFGDVGFIRLKRVTRLTETCVIYYNGADFIIR